MAYVEGGVLDAGGFTEPLRIGRALVGLVSNGSFRLVPIDSRGTVMGDRDGTPRIASPYGERDVHPDAAGAIDYVEKGYDADLGLVRMGVRDYDPKIGRFLTPDPLYLETLDKCVQSPVQCNLYGYAAGNPLLYVDSTGLESKYREAWETFSDPYFWAGMGYGMLQGYTPGGALLPPPGPATRGSSWGGQVVWGWRPPRKS